MKNDCTAGVRFQQLFYNLRSFGRQRASDVSVVKRNTVESHLTGRSLNWPEALSQKAQGVSLNWPAPKAPDLGILS